MNATELFHKDGRPAGVFYCGECRIIFKDASSAELCCGSYKCEDCGKGTGSRSWLVCDGCRSERDRKRELERFERAEKLTDWDGWVYDEGSGRNGYHQSVADLLEFYEDEERQPPEYVWACDSTAFATLGIDRVKDWILDGGDAYEDFDPDDLNGLEELSRALEKFNEANAAVLSYHPNYKRAVLVQPAVVTL
jgi:hypothetical protein